MCLGQEAGTVVEFPCGVRGKGGGEAGIEAAGPYGEGSLRVSQSVFRSFCVVVG